MYFGRSDGRTLALAPDGNIRYDVKAHSRGVSGIAHVRDSRLLVSVSYDGTLSVQNIDRFQDSRAAETEYELRQFVAFPGQQRVLYSWGRGPQSLKLMNLSTTSPEAAMSEEGLMDASITIGSAEARVLSIAVSRDGQWAVEGTAQGDVVLYDTDT